jgi:asparagine synthase (glutamine-hydrolysing)
MVAGGREVHTFTAGYGADDAELARAEQVARTLGTRHHPLVLDPADLPALLPWIAWHMEEPIGREDVALLFLAAREAAGRVDVLLTGFGFDRLFGGRRRHRLAELAIRYPALRGPLGELYDYVSRSVPPRSPAGRALKAVCLRGRDHPAATIAGAAPPAPFAGFPGEGPEPLGQLLRHAFLVLPGESPVERLYAGAGVKMNVQPTDPAFLGAAFALPDRLLIRGGRTKVGLRKACSSLLSSVPPAAGGRRDPPLCRPAIADTLQGLAVELLSPGAVRERGLFDPAYVADLLRRTSVRPHAPERLRRLWSLLLVELWSQTFLDRRGEPPSGVLPSVRRLEPSTRPGPPAPAPSRP